MWTLERRRRNATSQTQQETPVTTITSTEGALATAPEEVHEPATITQTIEPVDHFIREHEAWRRELEAVGGLSPLLHFHDTPANSIELSTTHPGGLPQFISGKKSLLSSLIRDDLALRTAKIAAGRVTDKALEMRANRGLETTHLAIGIATWEHFGETYTAPVLLRQLAIRRVGRDFELKLKARVEANSALIRALRSQFGIVINANELIALSQQSGVFKPQPVIDKLRQLTSGVPGFAVHPRLLVSSFSDVAHDMVQDAKPLTQPIFAAVCGSEIATEQILASFKPVNAVSPDQRSPESDRLLLDADAQQDEIVAHIAAGNSIVVNTLPGTGATQTVVNAAGALVSTNKRVLVVSPRRATLDAITHRLSKIGLTGAAVTVQQLRRNLVESISRNESVQTPQQADIDEALLRLRSVLVDYQDALSATDERYGVSPLDALRALTQLALEDPAPSTTARLGEDALKSLALDRVGIAALLSEAAALGQFDFGPEDSPWYGVTFATTEHARSAYNLACVIHHDELPKLLELADAVVAQTSMRPYESIAELGIYLRLLMGVRETLDRFVPEVYDRTLTEVIAAHSPRGGAEMAAANRKRLRKLAREYVRPGVHISDMYQRLSQIQEQRVLWQRFTAVVGARPEVPVGISDVLTSFQSLFQDLAELDRILGVENEADHLKNMPIAQLKHRMAAFAEESEVLHNIQERTALLDQLHEANLDSLLDDLSARHVAAEHVAAELEQAWWQSVLENMLQSNKALLAANTSVLNRLESDFKLVDDAHAGANGQVLASRLADEWRRALVDYSGEAKALRESLKAGHTKVSQLAAAAPNLLGVLAPIWLVSPYEIAELGEQLQFDTVMLVDAGATTLVENLGALRRAKQIVAFGDPVIQTPSHFDIALREPIPEGEAAVSEEEVERLHAASALAQLASILPSYTLTRSYRAGGEDLSSFVNEHFYRNEIETLPWAGTYLGHHSIVREFVAGGEGLPDPITGAVESPDVEVARVVELVLAHASERPRESLMVITPSMQHATRVQHEVLKAFARRSDLTEFLTGDRAEPFTVLTLEQAIAQSRDRVIFSVGYGKTPHGRVLSTFGGLGQPGGERMLAIAVTRARRAMTIVSCITPDDLDPAKTRYGVSDLARLLEPHELAEASEPSLPAERDPLLADLAQRLSSMNMRVEFDYRGVIPLVASAEGKAVAVETDYRSTSSSLREQLRLHPAVLRRLGWHYVRVHAFDLFTDPETVAHRIAATLGLEVGQADNAEANASVADEPGHESHHDHAAAG